ncbi:peptide-methionine (S)-S-oxide reductase MsrA [Pseudomonas nunensis]|uniref:Peptide methionine sulfoxide reductase MsrA n=1 Tax=Pseudomonas nunensis TaxID=2961896 RepID=A0ABY5EHR6_9PSED|nr:peptide-methionine (S)-S-oxide reductase MsrA [Pseudomonas nunensis]KOY03755.1 methionine sulfoxide reductase A [Pseudomonas nunensis]KPN93424.1 methionine sulfoxide reductase A [Pseudomonas nunensis]MCL5228177.1 peptide-methionine (S)-S-oxide reductase MsrA [Pseudomonas nunensis]UTO14942.1 peptide-methionine (S)-S-oxide reductase MsrA [Pseudomonas nunensis]
MKNLFTWRRTLLGLAAASVIGQCSAFSLGGSEDAVIIPPPTLDETTQAHSETAVFAGGCFWGVQGVFQHVNGVKKAVSGYAGGAANTAEYEKVSEGDTGHAESVEVTFDPTQVTYGTLLQIYFSVAHNPTELNRQGPDSGTQYRSAIFPENQEQQRVAQAYIAQLDAAHLFNKPIVTKLETYNGFYPAEDYHQDFLTEHPTYPYIVINDMPKVAQLKQLYPDRYQEKAVLVKAGL